MIANLFFQSVGLKFRLVSRQSICRGLLIKRIFKLAEPVEGNPGTVGVDGPVTLVKTLLGMYLIIQVAHAAEEFTGLPEIWDSLLAAVLLQ